MQIASVLVALYVFKLELQNKLRSKNDNIKTNKIQACVSEKGNLQTFQVLKIVKDGEL